MMDLARPEKHVGQTRYLLLVAGLGGLLYGIDVGIIAGALPYLEASASRLWKLSSQQLGFVVAAVLFGSVLSSLVAGVVADRIGRRAGMLLAGILFSLSIPLIAMAEGYSALLIGRLLQGVSGGLIGVIVPLYLAESLPATVRGRGTALFQLMLTIGLVAAAVIGLVVAQQVELVTQADPSSLPALQDSAWRRIFWFSLAPGLLFTAGVLGLADSPRWLLARGRREDALRALLRTRPEHQAVEELAVIGQVNAGNGASGSGSTTRVATEARSGSLLQRRYVLPFVLACLILVFNQTTGINSILAYSVNILAQGGLDGSLSNVGDVVLKVVNALLTIVAVILVDRKGRRFLLMLGTAGMAMSLCAAGLLFLSMDSSRMDVRAALMAHRGDIAERTLNIDSATLRSLAGRADYQLEIAYRYGPLSQLATVTAGQDAVITPPVDVEGDSAIGAAFRAVHLNPFPDMREANGASLHIERARLGPRATSLQGWLLLTCLITFVASFAVGPGVCVWLALSELMPNRIRSNGMSIALLLNQLASTAIAAIFLPTVAQHGYAPMFFAWAGFTVLYFLTAAFLLPETRGKTLEEIGRNFEAKEPASLRRQPP